jgi:glyoxylate carboligase
VGVGPDRQLVGQAGQPGELVDLVVGVEVGDPQEQVAGAAGDVASQLLDDVS